MEELDRTTINAWEHEEFVNAVGGTFLEPHWAGPERIVQAGAQPTSVVQLMCELQRDWARTETVGRFGRFFFALDYRKENKCKIRAPLSV